jgi:hypothetical protein
VTTEGGAPHSTDLATRAGPDPHEDLAAWRWRNYTAHLTDIGYDLDAGGPPDDGFDDAVRGFRKRAGRG